MPSISSFNCLPPGYIGLSSPIVSSVQCPGGPSNSYCIGLATFGFPENGILLFDSIPLYHKTDDFSTLIGILTSSLFTITDQATEGERVAVKFRQISKSRGLLPSRYAANPQSSFHSLRGTPAACHRIRLRMASRRKAFAGSNPATDPKTAQKCRNASTKFRKTSESENSPKMPRPLGAGEISAFSWFCVMVD